LGAAVTQAGGFNSLMALLASNGRLIKCWRCGGNHYKRDCPHPASAEELAYPDDYSKWPVPGDAGRIRARQAPQLPPAPRPALHQLQADPMADLRQEMLEMMRLELGRFRQESLGSSASTLSPAASGAPTLMSAAASSAPTLMHLSAVAPPTPPPAIFCAPRGVAIPPGYVVIQDDPRHVWLAPAHLGPEALEEAIAAWTEAGPGNDAGAV